MIRFGKISSTLVVAGLISVAGCASQGGAWHKPGVSNEQWAVDRAYCHSYARGKAEEEYRDPATAGLRGGINDEGDLSALMARHDARRNAHGLYERCLMRRGYSRGTPSGKDGKSA